MKLSEPDTKHFFTLMWALQYFVNKKLNIHSKIKSIDEYVECPTEVKFEVRKALYENIKLFDSFIQENPQQLSKEDLFIISNWKNFIEGDFHIERFMKRQAIFIKGRDVYGVLGLTQRFDEMIHRSHLPFYVRTVLLPFKGKIVYDGMFQGYNMQFGGGIKRELKESYMIAKQNSRIIESLEPMRKGNQQKKSSKRPKNWKPELDELAEKAKNLRSTSEHPPIYSPAFSLVKASIEFAHIAISDAGDLDNLYKSLRKVQRALSKSSIVLDREEN